MTENVTNTQNNTLKSKPLGKDSADSSGHEFMLEMHTDGNNTPLKIGGINIDTLFFHNKKFRIVELLLCGEGQFVTPHTSHPNRYWTKNRRKFLMLWGLARACEGELWLLNYARAGTAHEDKVRLIKVLGVDKERGITREKSFCLTRAEFKGLFQKFVKKTLLKDDVMRLADEDLFPPRTKDRYREEEAGYDAYDAGFEL